MPESPRPIERKNNDIMISGEVYPTGLRRFASALHEATQRRGYRDIQLDFSNCSSVFESFMLPAVALCAKYRSEGVDINLVMPESQDLAKLFRNANWAHLIDPRRNEESNYQGVLHLPAVRYKTSDEQHVAVDRAINAILSLTSGIDRNGLKALEWALNEITENVLNHAETPCGGFLQLSSFREASHIEFIVADAGIGIPASLKVRNHDRALEEAVREGVTKDRAKNAGNGLFGCYSVAIGSGGRFQLHSGNSSLLASADGRVGIRNYRPQRFPGTVVLVNIDCTKKELLEKALRFGGQPHDPPYDYIERKYENGTDGEMSIRLADETASFGSREAGKAVKRKITNLIEMNPKWALRINLEDVPIISSSFADEVFGRLFVELGPVGFANLFRFENLDRTVQGLIDRAIVQRSSNDFLGDRK